jgi:hypothetical protein
MNGARSVGRSLVSLGAVAWMILSLPHPARPYGIAVVAAVFAWALWKVKREDRLGRQDGVDCRCKWCRQQEEQETEEEGR